MRVRDIVRAAVVKTNPYWPFSGLNRMPYHLAIKAFVRLCKRFPEIKSVYLRHGLIQGNWVPGISDIDLTVITDSKLNMEEEFYLLRSFWKGYDSLKKLFPILGEAEVLKEEHIGSWTKFNIRGYESRNWRLIYGVETLKSHYIIDPERLAVDSLNHALWIYLDFFLRKFHRQERPSYLVSQEMQRLVFKIMRYANYFDIHDGKNQQVDGRLGDQTDVLCYLIKGLEKSINHFATLRGPASPRKNGGGWLDDVGAGNLPFIKDQALDLREIAPFREAMEDIFLAYKTSIVVLKNGLDSRLMKDCIDVVRRVFTQQENMPVIASSSIFNYMVRFYNPFLYTHLIRCGEVAYGKNLLSDVQPPDKYLFINKVLEQIPTVLTHSQGYKLISPPGPDWFYGRGLDSVVERSLFIKLYLERGVIKPWYHELLAESQKHYPEYYKKLRELQEKADCVEEKTLSLESFKLLKGIVKDIHNCLTNSSIVENLFLERSE